MIMLKDDVTHEIVKFFEHCEGMHNIIHNYTQLSLFINFNVTDFVYFLYVYKLFIIILQLMITIIVCIHNLCAYCTTINLILIT